MTGVSESIALAAPAVAAVRLGCGTGVSHDDDGLEAPWRGLSAPRVLPSCSLALLGASPGSAPGRPAVSPEKELQGAVGA